MKVETKVDTKKVSKPMVVKKPKPPKIVESKHNNILLFHAIFKEDFKLVKKMFKQGYTIDTFKNICFMERSSFEMMKLLFVNGFDPNNMENKHGNFVPFMFFCDDLDTVTLAIESYDADVNIVWEGHTSLYYRRINIAEYDIRRGNDILNNKMLVATYMESKGAISK